MQGNQNKCLIKKRKLSVIPPNIWFCAPVSLKKSVVLGRSDAKPKQSYPFCIKEQLIYILVIKCEIDPKCPNSPLLIEHNTDKIKYPPYGKITITLKPGEFVEFVCPGSKVLLDGEEANEIMLAMCSSTVHFTFHRHGRYRWSHISCQKAIKAHTTRTKSKCIGGTIYKTGFLLEDKRFLPILSACLNDNNRTLYIRHVVKPIINQRDIQTSRPIFNTHGDNYHFKKEHLKGAYSSQQININRALGLHNASEKYFRNDCIHYLSKGHLASRADFFYAAEQNATFHYMNSAPQWAAFNLNNWKILENAIRRYATKRKTDLIVWTGTYATLSLPHEKTKKPVKIYLQVHDKVLPVPLIFWKIVYSPEIKKGVVFIGINNIYADNGSSFKYCKDVTEKIQWVIFKNTSNMKYGHIYACGITSFRKAFPTTPYVRGVGLLY